MPIAGSSHVPCTSRRPVERNRLPTAQYLIEPADLPRFGLTGRASCSNANTHALSIRRDQIEIRHAPSKQRMSFAEIVSNVQTGHHRREFFSRFFHPKQLGHALTQRLGTIVNAHQRDLRHRRAKHARADRMPLGMIRIQQSVGRRSRDNPRKALHPRFTVRPAHPC